MDEDLLIDILSALKAGEEYPNDIVRAWEKNFIFVDRAKLKEHWEWLKSRQCIIQKPGQNDLARVIINPANDILPKLLDNQRERNKKADDANEIERLKNELTEVQIRLSKAQEKDIPINATDRKTVIFWQIASVLLALAGFLIGISVCRS